MDNVRNGNGTSQCRVVSVGEAARELGVSDQSIRNYVSAGELECFVTAGGHRRISIASIRRWQGCDETPNDDRTVIYSRCSTSNQTKQGNLARQSERLLEFCEGEFQISREKILVISETGSGLNESRKGYLRLIDLILAGKIGRVVVEHRDRLARYGVKLFEVLCDRMGVQLIVTNSKEDVSEEEDLTADLMSIVTVYSARLHGRRGGEEKRMVLSDEVKSRVIHLHQQGLSQTEIVTVIRRENFRCPKTGRKYAIHAVRQTIHQQEKIQKVFPTALSPIERFISERCIRAEGEKCFSKPFHREYSLWAEANNLPTPSSQNLTNSLKRLGFKLKRNSSGYSYFEGIGLKGNPRASRSHLG